MKHKLLQTWARKSAKLLAAIALLATTAFGAKAEEKGPVNFSTADFSGISGYNFYTSSEKSGITLYGYFTQQTSGTDKRIGLAKYQASGSNGNWIAVKSNSNTSITKIVLQGVKTGSSKKDINLVIYKNDASYNMTETNKYVKDPAGSKVAELTVITTDQNDKSYNINDKYFLLYNSSSKAQIQIKSIDVYYDDAPIDPNKPATPTFTPDGGEVDANTTVTIAGDDKTQSLKYWFGEDATAATTVTGATANVTITEACTLNAIAIGEGDVESGVKTANYTIAPVKYTFKPTTELTSGKYVFMCGEKIVNPVIISSSNSRCALTTDFAKEGDDVKASEMYEFTVTVDGDMITIQLNDGSYLGINNDTDNYFTTATDATTDNQKWTYTVVNGAIKFASAKAAANVLANHARSATSTSLYGNFAPGADLENNEYPVLYKLYVAPVAPELPAPTAEDGVEVDVVDGGWGIRPEKYPVTLTFAVEDGVQIYAKKLTAAQTAAEDDNAGYTALPDNKLTLTKSGEEYSVYAMKDGVKSEAKTITANVPSGIAGIEAENGEAVYFNLQGVRVENPENGIFIRVQNGKAVKIMK